MEDLNELYLDLINPKNIINHFKSDEEFKSWCECGDSEALECALEAFTKEELYEHCCIIRDTINGLKVKKLLK
jgi:hypothetical protein